MIQTDNDALVREIILNVAELPDRTSPDDWPEAMLVTADELETIVLAALRSTTKPLDPPARDEMNAAAQDALATWLALPEDQRSEERPWIQGFNAGWEQAWDCRLAAEDDEALRKALRTAIGHIEHMAAWISKQKAGYSFASLGEDMPDIRAALAATRSTPQPKPVQGETGWLNPNTKEREPLPSDPHEARGWRANANAVSLGETLRGSSADNRSAWERGHRARSDWLRAGKPLDPPAQNEVEHEIIERLLDAQQDINLAANSHMDQGLADASALIDEIEPILREALDQRLRTELAEITDDIDRDTIAHAVEEAGGFILSDAEIARWRTVGDVEASLRAHSRTDA